MYTELGRRARDRDDDHPACRPRRERRVTSHGRESLAQQSLDLARRLDMPELEAQALSALASAHRTEKNPAAAYELTKRSAKYVG